MKGKVLANNWWQCVISKSPIPEMITTAVVPDNKIMSAVISEGGIQCLEKDGFHVKKLTQYTFGNIKSFIQA